MPHQLLICTAIKVLIILLTIVTLILLDPTYVTAYISVNYEIVFIYIIAALSLLYCLVSIVMYAIMNRRDDAPMTNCALSEVVFFWCWHDGMVGGVWYWWDGQSEDHHRDGRGVWMDRGLCWHHRRMLHRNRSCRHVECAQR